MMERLFERDVTLKVLSVCLAVLLWFQAAALTGPALPQPVRDVPIAVRNLGQGLVVLSSPPTVTLLVKGRSDALRMLSKDSFTAYVDLRGAGIGPGTFPVLIEGPDGVTVSQITPAEVGLNIDAWDNRQVPVSVWTTGTPAADHAMKNQQTRPTDLYVEGPRSRVQLVTRVVAKVDISGAKSDLARTVVVKPVDADGADVSGVTVTPSAVDVTVSIVKLPPPREVTVRANVQGRLAPGYIQESVTIEPAEVRIYAAGAVADELRYVWTYPIEIEGAAAPVTRDVMLLVPAGVEKIEPQMVKVTVNIVEVQEEREFRDVPVETANIPSGLRSRLEPETVTVVVRGPRSRMAALELGQVTVRLDLADKAAGTHQIRPVVVLPEGLSVKSLAPLEIKVVLETP